MKLGSSPPEWLAAHADVWPFVLPQDSVQRLLSVAKEEPWATAKSDVVAVTSSGLLGMKLFGYAMKEIADTDVTTIINDAAVGIWSMQAITRKSMADLIHDTEKKVDAVEGVQSPQGTRVVEIDYRGYVVEMEVKDLHQQVYLTFQAALRGYASESGDLEALPAEKQLCGSSNRAQRGVVEGALLCDAKSSRAYARKVLMAAGGSDGKSMMDRA